ncbi:hypothetical protein OB919_10325 [Halobacteria archaeon AArc-curdl1]|uniref:Uncharacterized protein n=1 Tax=Natronosalvus hydrolyticus TaxID=2979988 RepID=A0AAP2Z8T0_9EURY|nr:hypothetical protein [Halobacteria archaeon AArc-curdl1]
MKFNEGDTIEITIQGVGPQTYLSADDEATVQADVANVEDFENSTEVFFDLHDDIGGLDEARIDWDLIPVENDDGTEDELDALTTFDSEEDEGPYWAGAIVDVEVVG